MQWLLRIVAMFSVAMRDATFVEQIEDKKKRIQKINHQKNQLGLVSYASHKTLHRIKGLLHLIILTLVLLQLFNYYLLLQLTKLKI